MKNVKIIRIESDFGAGKKGAKLGPAALIKELPAEIIKDVEQHIISSNNLDESEDSKFALNIESIIAIQHQAISLIEDAIEKNQTPWIISGDHSNGLAAISAYKNKFPLKKLGVIWIDAHADLHTPFSSPSGNVHGMPLAAALGFSNEFSTRNELDSATLSNWNELIRLGSNSIFPKITPDQLVFIDIRDLEEEEIKEIQQLSIKHFTPENRKEIGIKNIIAEAINHLSHCDNIVVSFDVDSLDPSISYGTGTPVQNGLSKNEAIELLSEFLKLPNLFAFEITEINPLLDRNNPMEIVAAEIIKSAFKNADFIH